MPSGLEPRSRSHCCWRINQKRSGSHDSPSRPHRRFPRRRAWHALPARDQGDAQGDAARRRQAIDPICGRGGAGGWDRAAGAGDRARQDAARGSFRPCLRTECHARRAWQAGPAGRYCGNAAGGGDDRPYPPAGSTRPGPRGLVRARGGRRRAFRGAPARRSGVEPHAGDGADGRRLRTIRR